MIHVNADVTSAIRYTNVGWALIAAAINIELMAIRDTNEPSPEAGVFCTRPSPPASPRMFGLFVAYFKLPDF